MEKVWANKLSYQKEIDMIPYSLFGFGVPNPDESGCWRDEKGPALHTEIKDPPISR